MFLRGSLLFGSLSEKCSTQKSRANEKECCGFGNHGLTHLSEVNFATPTPSLRIIVKDASLNARRLIQYTPLSKPKLESPRIGTTVELHP